MDLPGHLINFIEVLQFDHGIHDVWYDTLNMGFRTTPMEGRDYSCGDASVPGRERFYTQVARPLTYESWLDGVRKGRTFITNGPMLDFHINGKGIGHEVFLRRPGQVLLARFKAPHRSQLNLRQSFWPTSGSPSWKTWKHGLRRTNSGSSPPP